MVNGLDSVGGILHHLLSDDDRGHLQEVLKRTSVPPAAGRGDLARTGNQEICTSLEGKWVVAPTLSRRRDFREIAEKLLQLAQYQEAVPQQLLQASIAVHSADSPVQKSLHESPQAAGGREQAPGASSSFPSLNRTLSTDRGRLVRAVQPPGAAVRRQQHLENHGGAFLAAQPVRRHHRPQECPCERALRRIRDSQVLPVRFREVAGRLQFLAIRRRALDHPRFALPTTFRKQLKPGPAAILEGKSGSGVAPYPPSPSRAWAGCLEGWRPCDCSGTAPEGISLRGAPWSRPR